MKPSYLLVLFLLCLVNPIFGQKNKRIAGWYVEPSIGYHQLKIGFSQRSYFSFGQRAYKKGLVASAKFGRQFPSGVNIQTGFAFMPKGFTADNLNIPPLSEEEVFATVSLDYKTIHFPLLLGYQFNLTKNLALRSSIGLIFGTSFGYDYEEIVTNRPLSFTTIEPAKVFFEKFDAGYIGEISLFYKLTQKVSFVLSGNFMENSIMLEVFPDASLGRRPNMHNQGFYFTVGSQIKLFK